MEDLHKQIEYASFCSIDIWLIVLISEDDGLHHVYSTCCMEATVNSLIAKNLVAFKVVWLLTLLPV